MLLKKILVILILTIISHKEPIIKENNISNIKSKEIIGSIIIEKLNINMPLYDINNPKNNIEQNIQILKESILPPNKNSIVFLAAHSGDSNISYFDNLDELKQKDIIQLKINNKTYTYQIKSIYKQKKNGYINVNKEIEDQLILTTCDPNSNKYQLIINSTKKEFN